MSHKTIASIDMTLDAKSIDNAIREIRHIKEQLVEAMNDLIRKLADEGVKEAKAQVAAMDAVDTGELERSIYGYYDPDSRIGYVIAGAAHAFYVEYGTGIVGAGEPHPDPKSAAWAYDVNDHGEGGWWYPSEKGWYLADDGTRLAWTKGMPARPFMYNTMVWLEEAARALGRTILS